MNWENSTRYLVNFPKTKFEEGMIDPWHRSAKRRTPNQSTEHELEVLFYFLFSIIIIKFAYIVIFM